MIAFIATLLSLQVPEITVDDLFKTLIDALSNDLPSRGNPDTILNAPFDAISYSKVLNISFYFIKECP